jgi:hypothetical protein
MAKTEPIIDPVPTPEKPIPEEEPVVSPEQQSKEIDFSPEEIGTLRAQIKELLNDYEIMPDSFIMPADYEVYDKKGGRRVINKERQAALDEKLKNKLRNKWFALSFARLNEVYDRLRLDTTPLIEIKSNFSDVVRAESEATVSRLTIDDMKLVKDPALLALRYKEIKQEIVPDFAEQRAELTKAVDFLLLSAEKQLAKL